MRTLIGQMAGALGKVLLALAVFGTIFGGWQWMRTRAEAREHAAIAETPLPDAHRPSGACTLWFIGSSSIHNWRTLGADMAPWDSRNRGIPGATMDEIVARFENGAAEASPRAIVFYAGENDIAFGRTPQAAFDGLAAFLAAKRRVMGQVPVIALSLKPSPTRWHDRPQQIVFNEALKRLAAAEGDLAYLDISPLLMNGDRPGDFYVEDGIHLNPVGYHRLSEAVRAELPRALPDAAIRTCERDADGAGA